MPFRVYEFQCGACRKIFDDLVQPDQQTHVCPDCGKSAKRILSAPRFDIRMGIDAVGSPTMGAKWARQHEQARKADEKRSRDNGPGAWGSDGADVRR